jgi:acetoin utilization deacetylase AcuC-like enzyme
VARLVPAGRLILYLEGGYDLGALKGSVAATLEGMAGRPRPGKPNESPRSAWQFLEQALEAVQEGLS